MFSGGSVAAVVSAGTASASPAPGASTIGAASLLAAGQAAGVVSAKVVALTEGVLKAMFVAIIKSVLAVVLVVGLALGGVGAGVGLYANPAAVAQEPGAKQDAAKKPKPADEAARGEAPGRALLPDSKAVPTGGKDGKMLLPGETKRDSYRGVILRVKLVELDAKALLMTAEVVCPRHVDARANGLKLLRLENLPIAGSATVNDGKKELKLGDLKAGSILRLQMESYGLHDDVMAVSGIRVGDDRDRKPELRAGAADPKPAGNAKMEVAGLAKEIAKMKIVRQFNEKVERSPAEKTIQDKAKVAQVLALFPAMGTKGKPDDEGGRGYSSAFSITLYREKGDPIHLWISHDRKFWSWSEGANASPGDWYVKKPREVGKLLDGLLK